MSEVEEIVTECAKKCEHLVEEIEVVLLDNVEEPKEMLIVFTDGHMARVSVVWVD